MGRGDREYANMRAFGAAMTALLLMVMATAVWAGLARAEDNSKSSNKDAAEALKTLKGTWVGEQDDLESRWAFDGEKVKATVNGLDYECKVKIDPAAKPHSTIDFIIEEGPEESKGKTSPSIYKLEGEALVLCVALPDHDRPTDFEGVEGESFVFKLKKEKASDTDKK